MSKGWRNVHGSEARMLLSAANDEVDKENKFLRRKLRAVATGVMTDVDAKYLTDMRKSEVYPQGGCPLSSAEMAVLYRMQAEGTL